MDVIVFVGLAVALMSAAVVIGLGRRHAWRWGEVSAGVELVGEGAYREVIVQRVRPRGVPPVISWSAGLGYLWAALTFFVFSPAGLLLALLAAEQRHGPLALALVIVCLSGLALAIGLVIAGTSLLRCRLGAGERARWIGGWSVLHHVAVLATMALLAISWTAGFLLLAAIPCILGLVHALSLLAAARFEPAVPNEPTV